MSEKFRLDRKIGFQNMFYTKCINVVIDSIGPLIILASTTCADLEGAGGPDPPEKSQNIGVLNNTDPLKNQKAIKPAFKVGPSSVRQQNAMHKMVFGSSMP